MNLAQVLSEACKKYGDQRAVFFEGKKYTFREIDEEVRKRAIWLKTLGIQKGDRVALQLPKSMEFLFIHLGVLSIGAITLPLNPDYAPEEVHYYLSDSGASLFVTYGKGFERNRDLAKGIQGLVQKGTLQKGTLVPKQLEKFKGMR